MFCVDDGVPAETIGLMLKACVERQIEFTTVDARAFDFEADQRCVPGDLLYRPAVSTHAQRVEQHLIGPGVGTFYPTVEDAWFATTNSAEALARTGVPLARTIPCATIDRQRIGRYVERLGGLPIVVKVGGFEGGMGVMIAETMRQLLPLLDYLIGVGGTPLLISFVPDAVHWRLVVVGDAVVASYRNVIDDDDFRTYAGADPSDYEAAPPPAAIDAALLATRAIRRQHSGCDVLEHASGRVYVLEANFPCYFPQAQSIAGVDIAGAMVDHLLARAAPHSSRNVLNK